LTNGGIIYRSSRLFNPEGVHLVYLWYIFANY
jgi:hypothetical protein